MYSPAMKRIIANGAKEMLEDMFPFDSESGTQIKYIIHICMD